MKGLYKRGFITREEYEGLLSTGGRLCKGPQRDIVIMQNEQSFPHPVYTTYFYLAGTAVIDFVLTNQFTVVADPVQHNQC